MNTQERGLFIALIVLNCGLGQLHTLGALKAAALGLALIFATLIRYSIRTLSMPMIGWWQFSVPFSCGERMAVTTGLALFLGFVATFALLVARGAT